MIKKRTKYNVSKDKEARTCNGIVFDSALEMRYYKEYVLPKVESGEILFFDRQKDYELQPSFIRDGKRIRSIGYRADFVLQYANGREVVVDIKGHADNEAILKRKMFMYVYPDVDYQWISWSKTDGWVTYEEVQEQRNQKHRDTLAKKKKNQELKKGIFVND